MLMGLTIATVRILIRLQVEKSNNHRKDAKFAKTRKASNSNNNNSINAETQRRRYAEIHTL
jgi:hypothetical protein